MDTETLKQGSVIRSSANIFFDAAKGTMITHRLEPVEHYVITNHKGEAKFYFVARNEAMIKRGQHFSTSENILVYFLSGNVDDMGLNEFGYNPVSTRRDANLLISRWEPAAALESSYSAIELVHEDGLPIYIGYYVRHNREERLLKKIYYSHYQQFSDFDLPLQIVEFNYFPSGDSLVNRTRYSEIKTGRKSLGNLSNFKIPYDAKIIE